MGKKGGDVIKEEEKKESSKEGQNLWGHRGSRRRIGGSSAWRRITSCRPMPETASTAASWADRRRSLEQRTPSQCVPSRSLVRKEHVLNQQNRADLSERGISRSSNSCSIKKKQS
nr:uncharacterized protein LOC113698729 [Coffea arabica]